MGDFATSLPNNFRDCPKICTVFTILSRKGSRWVGGLKKKRLKGFQLTKNRPLQNIFK